jgi:hypothetical protein
VSKASGEASEAVGRAGDEKERKEERGGRTLSLDLGGRDLGGHRPGSGREKDEVRRVSKEGEQTAKTSLLTWRRRRPGVELKGRRRRAKTRVNVSPDFLHSSRRARDLVDQRRGAHLLNAARWRGIEKP